MITIYKGLAAKIEATVLRGCSKVKEDFSRASVAMFLIGKDCKLLLMHELCEGGVLKADVPAHLHEGVYALEIIWAKNEPKKHCHDMELRSVMRSRKDELMAVSEYADEATSGSCVPVIKITMQAGSYGYDGLSAYEMAVLKGKTELSEEEWIDAQGKAVEKYEEIAAGKADKAELEAAKETTVMYVKADENRSLDEDDESTPSYSIADETKGLDVSGANGIKTYSVRREKGASAHNLVIDAKEIKDEIDETKAKIVEAKDAAEDAAESASNAEGSANRIEQAIGMLSPTQGEALSIALEVVAVKEKNAEQDEKLSELENEALNIPSLDREIVYDFHFRTDGADKQKNVRIPTLTNKELKVTLVGDDVSKITKYTLYLVSSSGVKQLQNDKYNEYTEADKAAGYNTLRVYINTATADGDVNIIINYRDIVINTESISALNVAVEATKEYAESAFNVYNLLNRSELKDSVLTKSGGLYGASVGGWKTYYKIRVHKGDYFRYAKMRGAATSLTNEYAYFFIYDNSGARWGSKTGTGSDNDFTYQYTFEFDGFISICIREDSCKAELYTKYYHEDQYNANNRAFSAYKKFGVIGDSLSVGYVAGGGNRNIPYSWGQILAKRNSQVCLNFGKHGLTASTFFTENTDSANPYSIYNAFLDSNNLCQTYIVALGVNHDSGGVGTINDINWDNPDASKSTFYGQYGRLLCKIRQIAPSAAIFCLTIPYPREIESADYNTAIRAICADSHLSNIILVELTDYNPTLMKDIVGDIVTTGTGEIHYKSGHFTPAGYAMLSEVIEDAVSKGMCTNAKLSCIEQLHKAPYGSNDVLE